MPLEAIRVSSPLPLPAARIYAAWLDAHEHSRMTGSPATVDATVGGRHTAWDGYIEGEILELEPGVRIVQTWRSREFPEGHAPSLLEIRLRDTPGGCEILISHGDIPEGQSGRYEAGWHEHYFIPMTKYFRALAGETVSISIPPPEPKSEGAPGVERARAKRPAKKAGKKAPAKRRRPSLRRRGRRLRRRRAGRRRAPRRRRAARRRAPHRRRRVPGDLPR